MCDDIVERYLDEIFNEPQGMLVKEFMEWADFFCPFLTNRAYYALDYDPPRIDDELLDYSLRGLEALKV